MSFGGADYDVIDQGCNESAQVVVPLLMKHLSQPETVIDVGCGRGWWGRMFAQHGCAVIGIDGTQAHDRNRLAVMLDRDLAEPNSLAGIVRADVAICLEVAEHLPPLRAESFIAELCALAPIIVFSAAIPGQGGINHLNEQWPRYWQTMFEQNGYVVSGKLRWGIWDDDRVENWYRQNLLIAAEAETADSLADLFTGPGVDPYPVVHPVLFNARRA